MERLDVKNMVKAFFSLREAKEKASLSMKLIIAACTILCAMSFFFAYMTIRDATNRILVVNTGGEILKLKSTKTDELYKSLLQAHCSSVAYYVNSFDKLSISENRARASFLVAKNELNQIYDKYLKDRAYSDAQNRGIVYKCEFDKLQRLSMNGEVYSIIFTSILTIYDGSAETKIRILSRGNAIQTTPSYPENVSGFFFTTYTQEYERIDDEE